jgi:hypothetical protein
MLLAAPRQEKIRTIFRNCASEEESEVNRGELLEFSVLLTKNNFRKLNDCMLLELLFCQDNTPATCFSR